MPINFLHDVDINGEIKGDTLNIDGAADITGNITGLNGSLTTTSSYYQLNTPSGYIQMGAMNTGHAHMYTDRPDFYFNKAISINGANVLTTANTDAYFQNSDVVMNENPFGGRSLYNSMINNPWFLAADRYTVTQTGGTSISNAFNGDYESSYTVAANGTATFNIDFGQHPGYPYGWIYLSFYYTHQPSSISGRVYNNYAPHTVGWSALTFTDVVNTSQQRIVKARQSKYGLTDLEITLTAPAGTTVRLTSCEIHLDRPGTQEMPVFNKFRPETIYKALTVNSTITSTGKITGTELEGTSLDINGAANFKDDGIIIDSLGGPYGRIHGTSSIFLGGSSTSNVQLSADLIPDGDSTRSLGNANRYWSHTYTDAITTTGKIQCAGELEGASLDINGNAAIDGSLSGTNNIIYGANATGTTQITGTTLDASSMLKSGFYRVNNTGSTIPNSTSVNFLMHTSYDGITNQAGFDLAANDSTSSQFYLRPATGGGKGAWQTIITDVGTQTISGAKTFSANTIFGGTLTLPSSNTLTGSSGKVAFNGRVSGSTPTGTTDFTTKAYVDLQLANLVDSAPGALDTLNELAAAINDDASFSTTITNSIATKLPSAGGTMSGDIAMGNNDITGVKFIQADGNVDIRTGSGEYALHANQNGQTALYNNGIKKFETMSTGATVISSAATFLIEGDGVTSSNLKFKTNAVDRWNVNVPSGQTNLAFTTGSTNVLSLDTSNNATFAGNINLPTAKFLRFLPAASNSSATVLFGNTSGTGGNLKFKRNADSATILTLNGDTSVAFAGNADVAGNVEARGYLQAFGQFYMRGTTQVMNKAASGFLNFLVRDTSGSETVMNISNVGTLTTAGKIQTAGEVEGGSLDINGNADISGTLTGLDRVTSDKLTINTGSDLFSSVATFSGDTYTTGGYKLGTAGTYVGKTYNNSGKYSIESDGGRDIQLGNNTNNSILFIDTSEQRIGINDTTPSQALDVNGNIAVTGTVDGRDVAADGTKLDTIDTNADVTPSWVPSSNPNYLTGTETIAAPASITTTIVSDTVNVSFAASTTSNIDNYLVFSSVAGSDYSLISIIPPEDMSANMSIIDNAFDASGTQAYRIYAVKNGNYSSPRTGSISFSAGTVEATNLNVVNLNKAFYIQWDAPSNKSRFVTAYNVYKHEASVSSDLSESSATLIYSGMNTNYMYSVSGAANNNFHKFWVTTTVA